MDDHPRRDRRGETTETVGEITRYLGGTDGRPRDSTRLRDAFGPVRCRRRDGEVADPPRPNSTVIEATYARPSDEEYIEKAEPALGIRADDEVARFDPSPTFCDPCDAAIPRGVSQCEECGTVYTPDAAGVGLRGRIREVLREELLDGQDGDDLLTAYLRDSLDDNVVVAISDQLADGFDSKLAVQGENLPNYARSRTGCTNRPIFTSHRPWHD